MPKRYLLEKSRERYSRVLPEWGNAITSFHPVEMGFPHVIMVSEVNYDWVPCAFFVSEEDAKTCYVALQAEEDKRAKSQEAKSP